MIGPYSNIVINGSFVDEITIFTFVELCVAHYVVSTLSYS